MTELVSGRDVEVSSACRLFGRSRQAYYRLRACGMHTAMVTVSNDDLSACKTWLFVFQKTTFRTAKG